MSERDDLERFREEVRAAFARQGVTIRGARRRAAEMEREADEALLRSGGPLGLDRIRGGTQDAIPDLGDPLLRRLALDPGVSDPDSSELYSANMLEDPAFESILPRGQVSVTTSWTSVGAQWEARIVVNSGDTPAVTARRTSSRRKVEGHIYRSNVLALDIAWADGEVGDSYVELRPKRFAPVSPHVDWPWAVTACRVYVDKVIRAITNLEDDQADARMILYDRTGAEIGTGDDTDVAMLSDDRMEAQPYVGTEDVDDGVWMVLQIQAVKTTAAGVGGVCIGVAEPQINYIWQEAPPPWDARDFNGPGFAENPAPAPVDDYERVVPLPEKIDGDWVLPAGPTRHLATVGVNELGVTQPFFYGGSGIVPYVASYVGWSFVNHVCFGSMFRGWKEQEVWWEFTVPTAPANMAGMTIRLTASERIVGWPGHFWSRSGVASTYGYEVHVSASQPGAARSGTTIGFISGVDSTTSTIFVPAALIPPEGQTMYVGVVAAWHTQYGEEICGFDWPYATGKLTSGQGWVNFADARFALWQVWDGELGDIGAILDGPSHGAWWAGNNPYRLLSHTGTDLVWYMDGHALIIRATAPGSVTWKVPGPLEEAAQPPGPWGDWDYWFEISIDAEGSLTEPGTRQLRLEARLPYRRAIATVHFGDPQFAPGISLGLSNDPYKAKAVAADTHYRVRVQVQGTTMRAKLWPLTSLEPLGWDVTGETLGTEDTDADAFVISAFVGNGGGGQQQLYIHHWEAEAAGSTRSGELVGPEFLGYGDGQTVSFTGAAWKAALLFVDGFAVIPSDQSVPESGIIVTDWPPADGAPVWKWYVAA